jgi:hypothetical protein
MHQADFFLLGQSLLLEDIHHDVSSALNGI